MIVQERFVAYAPGTDTLKGYLPQPLSMDVTYGHNMVGGLNLKYSTLAAGGDLLSQDLKLGLDIAVEWNFGGSASGWFEPYDSRFLLIKRNIDLNDPTKLVTIQCPSYSWLFGKVRNLNEGALVANGAHQGDRKMASKDAGDTMKTFLDEHAARRGQGVPITRSSWTTTQDSGGHNWAKRKTIYYPLGVDLTTVLQGLTDMGHCDWRVNKRDLQMWNANSNFTDRSAVVRLRVGQEVAGAPVDETMEDVVTHLFGRGSKKKVKATIQNTSGPHPWGYWEGFLDEGGIDDVDELKDAMQKELDDHSRVRGQYTYTLTIKDALLMPMVDYFVGDWVTADTPVGPQKVRVQQITMSRDTTGLTASVVLNDKFTEAALKAASKLISLSGGSTTIGGNGVSDDVNQADLRQPAAPLDVTATPALYLTSAKRWADRCAFTWSPVTTATDGTELDIAEYVIWGILGAETMRMASVPATSTSVTVDGFVPGDDWEFAVQAIGVTTTEPGALSAFVAVTMPEDTVAPLKTSAPSLDSSFSIITAGWNGLDYLGHAMAEDLARVEVLAGTANPPTAVVGNLNAAGTWTGYAEAGDVVYVAYRPVDFADNVGPLSDVASITVKSVLDDPDLTALLGTKARIYMQDAEPAAPIPAGSWWFTATGTTRLYFTAAGATVGSATWTPYLFDASQILTAGTILADNIGVNQIVNKHMASHSIDVDVLTGGLLQAQVTLSGIIRTADTGARVEIDSATGIVLYDAFGSEVISIRTDGNSRFYGKITASELLVDGVMSLSAAAAMTVNPGAIITLSAGIQAPSVSPGVAAANPKVQLKNADGTAFTGVACVTKDSTGKIYAAKLGSRDIHKFNADGTYNSLAGSGPNALNHQWRFQYTYVSDITLIGTTLYALMACMDDGNGRTYVLWNVTTNAQVAMVGVYLPSSALTGGRTATTTGADSGALKTFAGYELRLNNDGTNFLVGYVDAATGKEKFATFLAASGAYSSVKTNTVKWTAGQSPFWGFAAGNFDLGAKHYLTSLPAAYSGVPQSYVRHTRDSDSLTVTNSSWPVAVDNTVALGYYGGTFWTADESGAVYTHDGPNWTDDALLTRTYSFGYTYYNTTPYESKLSPVTSFAVKKRSRARVSVAGWTVQAPINQLRFYAGIGTRYAQGNNANGYLDILVPTASGGTPPVSSDFPASTPSKITNGGGLTISADGTIVADQVDVGGPVTSVLDQAKVTKSASGPAYASGTWVQVLFDAVNFQNGITASTGASTFTITKTGYYDIDFYQRWQVYGTAYYRLGAIVIGTSAPPTGANAGSVLPALSRRLGDDWYVETLCAKGVYLTAGQVVTFWIRSGVASTWNTATDTLVNKPPYAYIRRVGA